MHTRVAAQALFFLALGAVSAAVVAGCCAWFEADAGIDSGRFLRVGTRHTDRSGAEVTPARYGAPLPGAWDIRFRAADRAGVTLAIGELHEYLSFTPASEMPPKPPTPESLARGWEERLVMPWLRGERPWPVTGSDAVWVKASGWPFRMLYTQIRAINNAGGHAWVAENGFVVGPNQFAGWADWPPQIPRIVPLRPIWSGLAMNTIAMAFAWFAVRGGATRLRRHLRRRSGLCPNCAYDLRGSPNDKPCPECGRALSIQ